jgi:hypothetical protein
MAAKNKAAKTSPAAPPSPKEASRDVPKYRVEILTATRDGLEAFTASVTQAKNGRVSRGAMRMGGRGLTKGMVYPMAADGGSQGELAKVIGPLNRNINPNRADAYRDAMQRGEWLFTPDPIVVTDTGDIINGQHRLIAAFEFLPDEGKKPDKNPVAPPQFVVVWGVSKQAAVLMDEPRRSAVDRRNIAMRVSATDDSLKFPHQRGTTPQPGK